MTEGGEVEHSALYWLGRGLLPSDVPPLVSHFLKKKKKRQQQRKRLQKLKGRGISSGKKGEKLYKSEEM